MILTEERELQVEDLRLMRGEIGPGVHGVLKRIRDSHHQVARLLASGARVMEVAYATGYAPATISRLKNDPAFSELIEHYRGEVKEIFQSTTQKLAALSRDALDELSQRLEEDAKGFSNKMLLEMATAGADRSGAGVTSKSVVMHMGLSSADLTSLKEAAKEAGKTIIVDVSSVEGAEEEEENVSMARTTSETSGGEGSCLGEVIQFPRGSQD